MLGRWARTATHEKAVEARTLLPQYRQTGILSMLRGMNAIRMYRTDLALAQLDIPVEVIRGNAIGSPRMTGPSGWGRCLGGG